MLDISCRIAADDADALGKRLQERATEVDAPGDDAPASLRRQIDAQLARVYDPELPLSVVDLGLIYDLRIIERAPADHRVEIEMTLTTQACGMGPTIAGEIRERLLDLARVTEVDIDIVWEPRWSPVRISAAGRKKLGIG